MEENKEQKKLRQSGRIKKLSAVMRIVDEETRRIVMENRLDALENDKLFEKFRAADDQLVADEDSNSDQAEFVPSDPDHNSSGEENENKSDDER